MQKILFFIAIWIAKLTRLLISTFHLGQGSTLPGKIASSLKKDIISLFSFQENCKVIFVTGTNGKSSTCGLLASIIKATGKQVIYNKAGANLLSGIASTLCQYSNLFGKLNYDFIILETDEATLPLITGQLRSDLIAVTNLFRDQLDRFGELDITCNLIQEGINKNPNTKVLLNADDPRVGLLSAKNKIYYGFNLTKNTKNTNNSSWMQEVEEVTNCPMCKSSLAYNYKLLGHLGDYHCSSCNFTKPSTHFQISSFKTDHLTINFDLMSNGQRNNFFLPMIGVFNLYNALCAISIAKSILGITPVQIQKAFQTYSTIFGRGEKIKINNNNSWVYLIKNPSGATEVLKTLRDIPNARFLIAINDNYADGKDVSWLWDARFDYLQKHKKEIFVSGKRAHDMALRLKYANINSSQIKVHENVITAINQSLASIKQGETLYILPTYTVLLELQRKKIAKGC